MWSVEEVHVSHMTSKKRMSKRLSNQPTARLIMHAGTASVMLALDESTKNRGLSHWSSHNNHLFLLTLPLPGGGAKVFLG